MGRIRRIESGTGRVLLGIGIYLLFALIGTIVVGVANSNIVWGEANQYGRSADPRPPGGPAAAVRRGRGERRRGPPRARQRDPRLPLPTLTLAVIPAMGVQGETTVEGDLGSSINANDGDVDTERRVWKMHLPEAGRSLVVLKGDFTGYGVNAQIRIGREPPPIHGGMIPLIGAVLGAVLCAFGFGVARLRRRGKGEAADSSPPG